MKRAPTEMPVIPPRTTMGMHGGTRIPIAVAEETMQTVSSELYPAFFMAGVSREAIAETSAIVEPEMPEKKYSATTTTMPRPPRT